MVPATRERLGVPVPQRDQARGQPATRVVLHARVTTEAEFSGTRQRSATFSVRLPALRRAGLHGRALDM